ncbi:MAG: hypothetical protein RIA08_12445 [Roseovarius sp.]
MKAIAEYFRDLAADDRYFGAEPPTPDAEMLARIAEREIARRVEAHENEGRIVLRAAEAAAEAEEVAPEPAPEPKPEPKQIAAAAALARVEDESEALKTAIHAHTEAVEAEADEPVALEPAAETAIETPPQEQQPLVAMAPAAEDPVIAEDEVVIAEAPVAEEDDAYLQEAMADLVAEDDDAEDHDDEELNAFADVAEDDQDEPFAGYDEDYAEDDAEEVIIPPAPAAEEADSVAARLRRIRSVVAHSSDGYATDDYSEDEHAQDFLQRTAEELDATLAEDDAAVEQPEEASDETDEDDAFADLSARLAEAADETAEDPAGTLETAEADEADLDDGLSEDTLSQLLADAMPAEEAPANDTAPQLETEPEAEADDEAPFVLTGEEQVTTDAGRPLRARVLKMKRSEFEAAIASGQIEEDFDEDEAPAAAAPDMATEADDAEAMLSPEDEAELQRELAEVEAEMEQGAGFDEAPAAHEMVADEAGIDEAAFEDADAHDAEPEPEQMFEEPAPAPAAEAHDDAMDEPDDMPGARRARRLQGSDTESDASRLFDTADTHFEAPDSNKRRNAIQHLRAAVAATKAEKNAGSTLAQEPDEDPYRSDLASVVRPRRHRASGSDETPRSRRPGAETRQAPLKLVAEQRVDTPRDPVRPRRVSAQLSGQAESAPVEEGGFSEFAEQIGASTLPELLEAAAAYMADIEGRQQFSRPMLMGKLKEVELDSFSREDGLRSFGHLLRQGKLQKVKGGRFSITDQTEFRAQARHAG